MARRRFSSKLNALLLTRGACRAVLPAAVLWGIADWYRIRPLYGLIFAALTLNYVVVYILVWVAPALLNGPWRVRAWQTFVLLANVVVLPMAFKRHLGVWPWGFMVFQLVMVAALVVSTKIYLYLQERLPMASVFAMRSGQQLSSPHAPAARSARPTEPNPNT